MGPGAVINDAVLLHTEGPYFVNRGVGQAVHKDRCIYLLSQVFATLIENDVVIIFVKRLHRD